MNWRTDKPTADVIVAKIKWFSRFEILEYDEDIQRYVTDDYLPVRDDEIEKWADLEEEKNKC